MGDGVSPNDEWNGSSVPPPWERSWRHPSELPARRAATSPTSPTPGRRGRTPRRYSGGSLIVAAAAGALAMAAVLVSTNLVGPRGGSAAPDASDPVTRSDAPALTPSDGIVTIRVDDGAGQRHHAGLVIDRNGDIVTTVDTPTLLTAAFSTADDTELSVRTLDGDWVPLEFVATDPTTGLSVVRIVGGAETEPANPSVPELGGAVLLARASATSNPLVTVGRTERIVGVNAVVRDGAAIVPGLLTVTVSSPTDAFDLVVNASQGRVVGLMSGFDDHPHDNLAHAVPAHLAVRAGRRMVLDGVPGHGRLDAPISESDEGVVIGPVDPSSMAAAAGLRTGDVLVSLAGVPIDDVRDVRGALLARGRSSVEAVVVRDGQRVTLAVSPVEVSPTAPVDPTDPLGDDEVTFAALGG